MSLKILWSTLRLEGWFDTLTVLFFTKSMANDEQRNLNYDKQMSVNTSGLIEVDDQEFEGSNKAEAIYYFPSSMKSLKLLFRFLKKIIPSKVDDFVFIDIGCGKGKPMFLASELPFKKILGVESSRNTVEVAHKNLETYQNPKQQCFDLSIKLGDATEYEFPDEPMVVYFGNPFIQDSPLFNKVLDNLENTLKRTKKKAFVLYYCPNSAGTFNSYSFLKTIKHYRCMVGAHEWIVYESNIS